MTKTVVLPDAKEVEFPDDATIPEMNRALAWQYGDQYFPKTQSTYVPKELKPKGEFFSSLVRGWDMMEGMIGSGLDAVGEASGWEGLEKYGERVAEANQKEIEEWDRTHPRLSLGDVKGVWGNDQGAIDWIQQGLGELLPSMLTALGGGIAGSVLAPAAIGATAGAGLGAFLPSALMGTGEVQSTIKELDPDMEAPWDALGGGAIIGSLDVLGLAIPLTKIIGKVGIGKAKHIMAKTDVDPKIASAAINTASNAIAKSSSRFPRLSEALKIGVISSPIEGLTERLQELTAIEIAEGATGEEVIGRAERLLEATLMGLLGGGVFGGVAGAITKKGPNDEIIVDKYDGSVPITEPAQLELPLVGPLGESQIPMEDDAKAIWIDEQDKALNLDKPLFRSWLKGGNKDPQKNRLGNLLGMFVMNSSPLLDAEGNPTIFTITDDVIIRTFGALRKQNNQTGEISIGQIDIIKEELQKAGYINKDGTVIKHSKESRAFLKEGDREGIGDFKKKRKFKERGQQHSGEILGKAVDIEQQEDGSWRVEVEGEDISTNLPFDIETVREAQQIAKRIITESDPAIRWRLQRKNFPLGYAGNMAYAAYLTGRNFFRSNGETYGENAVQDFQNDIAELKKKIKEQSDKNDSDQAALDTRVKSEKDKLKDPVLRKDIAERKKKITQLQKEVENMTEALNTEESLAIRGREDIAIPISTPTPPIPKRLGEVEITETVEESDDNVDERQAEERQLDFELAFPEAEKKPRVWTKPRVKDILTSPEELSWIEAAKKEVIRLRKVGKEKEARIINRIIKEKESDLKFSRKNLLDTVKIARQYGSNNGSSKTAADKAAKDVEEGTIKGRLTTISLYNYLFTSIRGLGNLHPVFAPFAKNLQKYSQDFRRYLATSIVMSSGIRALNKEQRAIVNRFTEAGNILGKQPEISEDGKRMVYIFDEDFTAEGKGGVELKGQDAINWETFGENERMYKFKVGEAISLDQRSAEGIAYTGRVNALDTLYNGLIQSMTVRMGLEDVLEAYKKDRSIPLSERVRTIADAMDKGSSYLDSRGKPQTKKQMTRNADIITGLEENKRDGYFPNVREGDGSISISRLVKNEKGEYAPITVFRTDIIKPLLKLRHTTFEEYAKEYVDKNLPHIKEHYGVIEEYDSKKYGNKTYEDGTFVITYHAKDMDTSSEDLAPNIPMVEQLLKSVYNRAGTSKENQKAFEDALDLAGRQYQKEQLSKGIRSHTLKRKGVSGYITPQNIGYYHDKAFQLYSSQASRYIARQLNENAINDSIDVLDDQVLAQHGKFGEWVTPNLRKVARATRDFTMSPQGASSFFKSIAFFGFLGGNISSLLVNLTQNFVTGAYLHGIYGIKVRGTTLKAVTDATRMIKDLNITGTGGEFMILPLEIEGKTNDQLDIAERDLVNRGQALYKKFSRFLSKEEYLMLYELQQEGVLGRINTEAIAENADVSGDFMRQKLGVPLKLAKGIGAVGGVLTTIYSSGEMLNRVAASLAGYRAAKKFGVDAFNNFHVGVPGQQRLAGTLLDDEEGYRGAAQMLSDATQFNLDPANRPMMARLLGGVPIQFMPFVTMMIEVYGNAFFGRYGSTDRDNPRTIAGIKIPIMTNRQANRALIALVAQQLAIGGLFAIPFMDDLDEVVKALSKKLGMSTTSVYQVFYETLIDDMGLSADAATALLRGPLEGYGPISISKRIALSPFQNFLRATSNPFLMVGGPAASFLEGYGDRLYKAGRAGEWGKVLAFSSPTAITTNLSRAYFSATEGVYTGTGRQINDGLQGEEILFQMLGFTTQELSRDRGEIRLAKYLDSRMSATKDRLTDQITKLQMRMVQSNNSADRERFREKSLEILEYIREHDQGKEMEDQIDPTGSIWTSVLSRMRQELSPRTYDIAAPRKAIRPRIEELIK